MGTVKMVGVDMGGTKIHSCLVSENTILAESIAKTPSGESMDMVVDALMVSIENVFQKDCQGIGIGVPSIVDSKRGIVYNTVSIPSWNEVHLKEILEKYFKKPVFVNNDSNCYALGEKLSGKGINYSDFVVLTLGTGLGAGIIINNKLYCGSNTAAGEIGSIPYKNGIIEDYCASRFFLDNGYSGFEMYELAEKGDSNAIAVFEEYGKNLSEAIKIVLYAYDPEIIILGGSISKAFSYFRDSLWENLNDYMYPGVLQNLKIEKSELKYSAVLGAAALVY